MALVQQDLRSPPGQRAPASSEGPPRGFRGDVFRGPAEGVGPRSSQEEGTLETTTHSSSLSWLDDLCEAKVRKLGIAIGLHEDVLRLQVSVDDVLAMDVCKGSRHLQLPPPLTPPVLAAVFDRSSPLACAALCGTDACKALPRKSKGT